MKRNNTSFSWLIVIALAFALPTSQLLGAALISTEKVVSDLSKERDKIQSLLARQDVQKKIIELGVSPDEASQRVATLSDTEVQNIAGKIDQMHAGADGIYISFGALLLLVILFLIFRR